MRMSLTLLCLGMLWLGGCGKDKKKKCHRSSPEVADTVAPENTTADPAAGQPAGTNPPAGGETPADPTAANPDGASPDGTTPGTPNGADAAVALVDHEVSWRFDCEGVGTATGTDSALLGAGPHVLEIADLGNVGLRLSSNACFEERKLDYLFVIDVSASITSGTDPLVDGSCGRRQVVEDMISDISQRRNARFAVITFSGDPEFTSRNFFTSLEDLYADIREQEDTEDVSDILCDGVFNGTNYQTSLEAAEILLARNKLPDTTQGVFFLTDGEPNSGDDNPAAANFFTFQIDSVNEGEVLHMVVCPVGVPLSWQQKTAVEEGSSPCQVLSRRLR